MKKIKRLNEKELREIFLNYKKSEYSGNKFAGWGMLISSILPFIMFLYFIFGDARLPNNWLIFFITFTFGGFVLFLIFSIREILSLKKLKKEIEANKI